MNYSWPGNVRELENAIEHAVIMCQGDVIGREHFPLDLQAKIKPLIELTPTSPEDAESLPNAVEQLEKQLLMQALQKAGWNKRKAARSLGLTERMIGYKVKRYQLVVVN